MPLKPTLKRGALIAAANWQITLIQSVADSLFKLLIAAPVLGGVFLVALVFGAEPARLIELDWRELITTIVGALLSHPIVLAAFLASLGIVILGGSAFVFLVKGGTVATLVDGDRHAGPIEQPPLHLWVVARAGRFSAERFIDSCSHLFARFLRLGLLLMALYLASGIIFYLSLWWTGGWGLVALFVALFVAWVTLVNLLYLLVQIVVATDDCSVAAGIRRVIAFVRAETRAIGAVFGVVLALLVCATGASILATTALGLIAFVPFFGLAVLPLQLLAWLLRGIVFQFLGLTAIGAYLQLYRAYADRPAPRPVGDLASLGTNLITP